MKAMSRRSRGAGLLIAAVAGSTAACGPEPSPRTVAVRDSAGVRIVTTLVPASARPFSVGPPTLSIGSEAAPLNRVVGTVRLSDGRIVVADGGDSILRFYSEAGELVGEVGGEGDGPGEFRLLQSLGRVSGDTVWAYDFSHRRITFASPDASMVGVVELRPPPGSGLAVGVLPDGSILLGESWSTGVSRSSAPGLNRDPVAYVRYSASGSLIDTVTLAPGREVLLSMEDGRGVMSAAPLGRRAVHALVGETLAIGDQIDHEIRLWSPRGDLRGIMRWTGGDLEVGPGLRAAWREARLVGLPPEARAAAERDLAGLSYPTRRPAHGEILATDSGGLWVAEYAVDGDSGRWAVFDSAGVWQGVVSMPDRFTPTRVGATWVLGVSRDEFDVERVEWRPLRSRTGPG